MMKALALAVLIATTSFTAPPETLAYDFDPPAFPVDQHGTVFQYYLPAEGNFAANIGMMAQPYTDTLEAYDQLSRSQFQLMGLEVISAEIENGVLTYEYKGKTQGLDLRWYSRAMKRGDTVYIITVSAAADRWDEDSPALIESAKSFRLKDRGAALR